MNSQFSHNMHVFTEKPGDLLSADAHKIIKHRYEVAAKYSQDKSVLEVGVGQAIGSQRIAKVASSYVGGEYSTENIDLISELLQNEQKVEDNFINSVIIFIFSFLTLYIEHPI